MIDLVLLGCGGMTPLPDRWLSSVLVRCRGQLTLLDCGEGTQIPWRRVGWGVRHVGAICLSHTHADHVAGLPGVLHAIANADRTEPLVIFGPAGTGAVVAGLRTIAPVLPYEVTVTELATGDRVSLPGGLTGRVHEGDHALPCLAFRLDLPRAPRFSPTRARALGIPLDRWQSLQAGQPVRWAGGIAEPADVLGPPRPGLAVGYATDTRPISTLPAFLHGVDLLICEGTYGDDADAAKAIANRHMTFSEAATLAADAGAKALWLTHFSPALTDPSIFLDRATSRFPATTLGETGLTATLSFADD